MTARNVGGTTNRNSLSTRQANGAAMLVEVDAAAVADVRSEFFLERVVFFVCRMTDYLLHVISKGDSWVRRPHCKCKLFAFYHSLQRILEVIYRGRKSFCVEKDKSTRLRIGNSSAPGPSRSSSNTRTSDSGM